MKIFNTSGPNFADEHYTIQRTNLVTKGIELVETKRYFTIWAPRQTGKSTYFRQLADKLEEMNYNVVHINFENYKNASLDSFIYEFAKNIKESWNIDFKNQTELAKIFSIITEEKDKKFVLIIDEVEGINPEYFGDFLHSIRE